MLTNVTAFVPQILISKRYDGAVISILISVVVGPLLLLLFMYALSRYPGQGIPEIVSSMTPRWVFIGMMSYLSFIWFTGGMTSLLVVSDTTIRYITPDTPFMLGIAMALFFTCACVMMLKSDNLLFFIEVILFLNVPLILVIFFTSFADRSFNLDAVMTVSTHVNHAPSWIAICAATYVFSGYANMAILNRSFPQSISLKGMWMYGVLGFGILLTSFAIPIGYQGVDGVTDLIYPWITTSDSMQIELGIVERVMYIYLLLYSGITITNTILHWHVAMALMHSILPPSRKQRSVPLSTWVIVSVFAAITLTISWFIKEQSIQQIGEIWLQIRFCTEVTLAVSLFYFVRRRRHRE
jgi:hypothetical protein